MYDGGRVVHALPISKLLGYVQVFQVVVDSPLVLLQEGVGVAEAVTGLSLHHLVPQLPGQLQRFPEEEETTASVKKKIQPLKKDEREHQKR